MECPIFRRQRILITDLMNCPYKYTQACCIFSNARSRDKSFPRNEILISVSIMKGSNLLQITNPLNTRGVGRFRKNIFM